MTPTDIIANFCREIREASDNVEWPLRRRHNNKLISKAGEALKEAITTLQGIAESKWAEPGVKGTCAATVKLVAKIIEGEK